MAPAVVPAVANIAPAVAPPAAELWLAAVAKIVTAGEREKTERGYGN